MPSPSPRGEIFARETNTTTEKTATQVVSQNPDECYNIYDEGHGDLQVFTVADATDVKLAKDGKTVLIRSRPMILTMFSMGRLGRSTECCSL